CCRMRSFNTSRLSSSTSFGGGMSCVSGLPPPFLALDRVFSSVICVPLLVMRWAGPATAPPPSCPDLTGNRRGAPWMVGLGEAKRRGHPASRSIIPEKYKKARVKRALASGPFSVIVLGGAHDLSASVRRLGGGATEYVRV